MNKKALSECLNHNRDPKIDAYLPKEKPYKVYYGKGLVLEVYPNGSKYWRYRYRYERKEKKMALGVYPEVSLEEAADYVYDARALVKEGIDPMTLKKATKKANQSKVDEINIKIHELLTEVKTLKESLSKR